MSTSAKPENGSGSPVNPVIAVGSASRMDSPTMHAHLEPESGRSVRVQSVERAIALLRAVALADGDQASAPALAQACGLNRATAWRVLKTLESQGMVVMDRATARYSIGPIASEIGAAAGHTALVALAHPVLEETCRRCGETTSLAVVGVGGLTYIDEVTSPAVLSASWVGRAVPLHATSTGKVLLAWLPEDQARSLLAQQLPAFTATTITDPTALLADLALTRRRGYAECAGELEDALYGVSAPVFDLRGLPAAVLSIWGPRGRVADKLAALGSLASVAAQEVQRARLTGWHDTRNDTQTAQAGTAEPAVGEAP